MGEENVFSCWRCGNLQDYEGLCDWCIGDPRPEIDEYDN